MCDLLEASLLGALLGYFKKKKLFAHPLLESLIMCSLESEEFSACALFLNEGMKLNWLVLVITVAVWSST